MSKLAEAYVDIVPNLAPLERGLAQSKVRLSGFVSEGNRMLSGLRLNVGGLALAGGGAIGMGLYKAAQMGADLYETVDKVKVTFGAASKDMIGQADDLASKFGVVKKETLDASAAFGLMGKAAGLTNEESAKLGKTFVQLGLDLASYHNLSNEEAFTKLRAGLAGEAEPLRPLGIMLSEGAVKAEAMAMGLVHVKRELTDQEKILARISLIRKQAGPAVGNLEQTSESAANQMKKLRGEVMNMATDFGEKLLPSLVGGISLLHELGTSIKDAFGTGPVDTFTGGLQTFIQHLREANKDVQVIGQRMGTAWNWLNTPIAEMINGKPPPEWSGGAGASFAPPKVAEEPPTKFDRLQMESAINNLPWSKIAASVSAVMGRATGMPDIAQFMKDLRTRGIEINAQQMQNAFKDAVLAVPALAHPGRAAGAADAIAQAGLFGPLGGFFARGIAGLQERRMENLSKQLQAPSFSEASELARYQQQQQLESPGEKQQVEELKKVNAGIDAVRDAINLLGDALKRQGGGGLIPRWLGGQ